MERIPLWGTFPRLVNQSYGAEGVGFFFLPAENSAHGTLRCTQCHFVSKADGLSGSGARASSILADGRRHPAASRSQNNYARRRGRFQMRGVLHIRPAAPQERGSRRRSAPSRNHGQDQSQEEAEVGRVNGWRRPSARIEEALAPLSERLSALLTKWHCVQRSVPCAEFSAGRKRKPTPSAP